MASSRSWSRKGLVRNSTAPAFMACTCVVKKPEANFLAAVIPWSAARFSCFFMGAGVDWPLGTLLLRLSLREQHLLQRTPVLPTAAAQSPRGQLGHTPRVAHRRPAADACAATHRPA